MSTNAALAQQTVKVAPAPVTFHAEQARRRGQIWRSGLACLVAAIIAGIFLSFVTLLAAPVTLGIGGGLAVRIVQAMGADAQAIGLLNDLAENSDRSRLIGIAAGAAALFILPTLLPPPIVWIWLRGLMLRPRTPPWPCDLNVRECRSADSEERQFANVVEESAIAAGLPVPSIGIIDAAAPNIAMFGTSHDQAGIVVTRGLLDALPRAETQLLAAQMTGAIGNGDLRVAASLQAVYRAIGFFLALCDLPLRRSARSAIWTLLRFGSATPERRDSAFAELDAQVTRGGLGRLLLWFPAMLIVPGVTFWLIGDSLNVDKDSPLGGIVPAALLLGGAAVLFYGLVRLTLRIWTLLVISWPLALGWRSRRFLADASAVQLTGDPQALAAALNHLQASCAIPAGGERLAHLFACRPQLGAISSPLVALEPRIATRLERLRAMGATGPLREMASPAITPATTVTLGVGAVGLMILITNYRFTLFMFAIGLGALLAFSCGAGLLLFMTIVNL